jgi:hypothetical protein
MKTPKDKSEFVRILHSVNATALPKVRHPDGKLINHVEVQQEHLRRRAELLKPGGPHESETLKKSRLHKAQKTPLPARATNLKRSMREL